MLSLFAAALRSTPVSVAFAYKDLLGLVFGASTYTTNKKKKRIIYCKACEISLATQTIRLEME